MRVAARSTTRGARCPGCRGWSERVHGSYRRHPAHLPAAGTAVVLALTVRRFLCGDRECPRQTFAEQVSGLTRPYAHRTERQRSTLVRIALALAGRAGARLAHLLGMTAGRDTLLRLIRALPDPDASTPRVLGVDDFAFRRGHTYGTILIDISTHRPVDVLPDREAATLARWLADHPGVEVICRDRSTAYADGARAGAPDAQHCADRWHLFHNLVEAVEKTVIRHRALLPEPELPDDQPAVTADDVRAAVSTARTTAAPRTSGRISDRTRERTRPSTNCTATATASAASRRSSTWPATPSAASCARRPQTTCWSANGPAAPASSTHTSPASTSGGRKAAPPPAGCSRNSATAATPEVRAWSRSTSGSCATPSPALTGHPAGIRPCGT
ncbi:ISL3 family transposase [Streptomyces sp. NBS 14/10]|uniref:ISL3 family transposase n=1 Tax=Streptomyces sp. NBS 14/10 TaxID=1945643 RepID=UPI001C5271BD|nr:ISL3 family transposase [Streptomyces sp. NBS 14/10]KAK1186531.1 ISL3 family transposase [Streptomyces sp. NBS 14/10]